MRIRPLSENKLQVDDLVKALKEMENEKYISNAREIKKVIESEKGLINSVAYIEKIVDAF
jgi:sterol 3beta-glucosyltransferase